MEKVVLTIEQVNAMKVFLDDNGNDKEHLVDWFVANRDFRHSTDIEYRALADLKTSELSKALYIGYEIEQPEFQPGNRVMKVNGDPFPCGMEIRELTTIYDGWYICDNESRRNPVKYRKFELRHATPEEIYWLETLERQKVMDFRKGDIFLESDKDASLVGYGTSFGISVNEAEELYESKDFEGIYPVESFKPFPKEVQNERIKSGAIGTD